MEQVAEKRATHTAGEHCPTPWTHHPERCDPQYGRIAGRCPDLRLRNGLIVAKVVRVSPGKGRDEIAEANAKFIETAVNSHDDLQALCETVAAGMGNLPLEEIGATGVHGINDGKARAIYLERFVAMARNILAKAEGRVA